MKVFGAFVTLNTALVSGLAAYVTYYEPPEAMFTSLDSDEGAALVQLEDGRKVAMVQFGPDDGKVVFVFHSTPGSRFDLPLYGVHPRKAAEKLGVRVVCLDRPGYGLSDDAPTRTLKDWAQDVVQVADVLGVKRFSVIGLGGGGPYAMACAHELPRRHPGRLVNVGLVASDGPYCAEDAPPEAVNESVQTLGKALTNFKWSVLVWLRALRVTAFKFPESCIEMQSQMLQASPPDAKMFRGADKGNMLLALRESLRQDATGWFRDLEIQHLQPWGFSPADIDLPLGRVYLWHGAQDRVVPTVWGRYLASSIPGCKASFPRHDGHISLWAWRLHEILRTVSTDM